MAHSSVQPAHAQIGTLTVSSRMKTLYTVLMFLGVVAFAVGLSLDAKRAWHSFLIGFFYLVSLGLGGLFFSSLQHMTKAGWSVNIRRVSESLTSALPWSAGLAVLFLIGSPFLYKWLDPAIIAADPILLNKHAYLNKTFFIIRTVLCFALWLFFVKKIVGRSLAQDKTGDESLTHKMVPASVLFLLTFSLTYSFFSVDSLMSLEPHWFSTIFGVYTFAGLFHSTLATVILIILYLRRKGHLNGLVNENHLHDLGKFLFGFTVFWAYIAFSQFMLIWYANLPEETLFFIPRMQGGWAFVSLALIVFRFIVPFLALLPKWAKRTPSHLAAVCVLILIMQYVDLYWLVYPNLSASPIFSGWEILIFGGFVGVFLFAVTRFLSKHPVAPLQDPRAQESTSHHVVY